MPGFSCVGALDSSGVAFSAVLEVNSTSELTSTEALACIQRWRDEGQTVILESQVLVVEQTCIIDSPFPCSPPNTTFRISPLLFGCSLAGLALVFIMVLLVAVAIAAACGRKYVACWHGCLIQVSFLGVQKEGVHEKVLQVMSCMRIQLMVNHSRERSTND